MRTVRKIAEEWVNKHVILSEHCDIEYVDLIDKLEVLLKEQGVMENPSSILNVIVIENDGLHLVYRNENIPIGAYGDLVTFCFEEGHNPADYDWVADSELVTGEVADEFIHKVQNHYGPDLWLCLVWSIEEL